MADDKKKGPTLSEILSPLTGMSRDQMMALAKEVKENFVRLDNCVGPHDFKPSAYNFALGTPRKYVCTLCKGDVGASDFRWYMRGLIHGKKG